LSVKQNQIDYIMWQNRAVRFYLAARLLFKKEIYGPAGFCAFQSLENLLKATAIYHIDKFSPKAVLHDCDKILAMIKKNVPASADIEIEEKLISQTYQELTRYPMPGKGVGFSYSMVHDLDQAFADILQLVPFQYNSELLNIIRRKDPSLRILSLDNKQIKKIRKCLDQWL